MLYAYILVVQAVGFADCSLKDLRYSRRGIYLNSPDSTLGLIGYFRTPIEHVRNALFHGRQVDVQIFQYIGRKALFLFQ